MTVDLEYQKYFYKALNQRYLSPLHLAKALDEFAQKPGFKRLVAGHSFEQRPIEEIQWGHGPVKILMWAQMHGNEATAPQALLDFLQFLDSPAGKIYTQKVSLLILPQLNPDGAEKYTRRNAQGIDINRDALAQQSPEMRVFQKVLQTFKPQWCFNLHDQRSIFSVGEKKQLPATVSFLAASANEAREITAARKKSMQLIDLLHQFLQPHLPGQLGRYTDAFYPNALGDNLHRAGTPCVLIESGAHFKDENREVARRLNFLALTHALDLISKKGWLAGTVQGYQAIPKNKQLYRDFIWRNCWLANTDGSQTHMDIALQKARQVKNGKMFSYWQLADVGDLGHLTGLEEQEGGQLEKPVELTVGEKAHFKILKKSGDLIFNSGTWKIS
jgi:hypothetical protein